MHDAERERRGMEANGITTGIVQGSELVYGGQRPRYGYVNDGTTERGERGNPLRPVDRRIVDRHPEHVEDEAQGGRRGCRAEKAGGTIPIAEEVAKLFVEMVDRCDARYTHSRRSFCRVCGNVCR